MSTGLSGGGEPTSRFWRQLGDVHSHELDAYGFDDLKRRQALRYFTWRWDIGRLLDSEQLRFLLRRSSVADWVACGLPPVELSRAAWAPLTWPVHDRWLYVAAVRLLWQYAEKHGHARVMALAEPRLGNPPPVYFRGRLISQDLANSALESIAIERALAGRTPQSILEVGAGYGRTAFAMMNLYADSQYTIVDIEPALTIARWYLTRLFDPKRLRFVRADCLEELGNSHYDLALSISSLQEMTREQVSVYLDLFDRVVAGGCVYLKQWRAWYNPHDDLMMRFSEYPIPRRWARRFVEAAPVQTHFRQAAWYVPGVDEDRR